MDRPPRTAVRFSKRGSVTDIRREVDPESETLVLRDDGGVEHHFGDPEATAWGTRAIRIFSYVESRGEDGEKLDIKAKEARDRLATREFEVVQRLTR